MKIRKDFITNSSSSSFIICKSYLTEKQIEAIKNHSALGKRLGLYCAEESWNIEENDLFITGYTWMDNFDISTFFKIIGINSNAINWGEYPFKLPEEIIEPVKEEYKTEPWECILEDIKNEFSDDEEYNEDEDSKWDAYI